jgi:hypothetical protein
MRTLILMHKKCAVIQDKVMSIGRSTTTFDINQECCNTSTPDYHQTQKMCCFAEGKKERTKKTKNKQTTLSKNLISAESDPRPKAKNVTIITKLYSSMLKSTIPGRSSFEQDSRVSRLKLPLH